MYVFRELTDLSYPAIARVFGGRDHTTVIHAVEKIQRLMKERKQIYDQVTELIQRLKTRLVTPPTRPCGQPMWTTVWTTAAIRWTTHRLSTGSHRCRSAPVGAWGRPLATARWALTLRRRASCPQSTGPITAIYSDTSPVMGKVPTVKFRCERDVLADALGTAGRAATEPHAARCPCCPGSASSSPATQLDASPAPTSS